MVPPLTQYALIPAMSASPTLVPVNLIAGPENGLLSADELGGDYRFQTFDRCFPAYGFDVCLVLVDRRRLVLFLRNDFLLSG